MWSCLSDSYGIHFEISAFAVWAFGGEVSRFPPVGMFFERHLQYSY